MLFTKSELDLVKVRMGIWDVHEVIFQNRFKNFAKGIERWLFGSVRDLLFLEIGPILFRIAEYGCTYTFPGKCIEDKQLRLREECLGHTSDFGPGALFLWI